MNNLLKALIVCMCICFVVKTYALDILSEEKMVEDFYKLIQQKETPVIDDELRLFGPNDINAISLYLKNYSEFKSGSPIWSYLRKHSDWFVNSNISRPGYFPYLLISEPFKTHSYRSNQQTHENMVVVFPEIKGNEGGYGASQQMVLFRFEQNLIDIGGTRVTKMGFFGSPLI